MEDSRIPRGQLRASTFYNSALAPYLGRLHSIRSWSVRVNNNKQWLQIDVGSVGKITGVATQGRRDANQWVTKYLLSYSLGTVFKVYREKGKRFKVCFLDFILNIGIPLRNKHTIPWGFRYDKHLQMIWDHEKNCSSRAKGGGLANFLSNTERKVCFKGFFCCFLSWFNGTTNHS